MKLKRLLMLVLLALVTTVGCSLIVVDPSSDQPSTSVDSSVDTSSDEEKDVWAIADVIEDIMPFGLGNGVCSDETPCVEDKTYTVEGTFVGYGDGNYAISAGQIYIQDEAGDSIMLHTANDNDAFLSDLVIGMKIRATGISDVYNGLPQLKAFDFEIIDDTIADVPSFYQLTTINDILEAEDLESETRGSYILKQVKLENLVVYSEPTTSATTTFASLADILDEKPVEEIAMINVYRFGQINSLTLSPKIGVGDVVDLYASVTAYNYGTTNTIQLHATRTAEAFQPIVKKEVSAEVGAKLDAIAITLDKVIRADKTSISLPTVGKYGSVIEWETSHPDIIALDGKVTHPAQPTKVTLTANVTGTAPKTYYVHVISAEPTTVEVAFNTADDDYVFFKGIISKVKAFSEQYKNQDFTVVSYDGAVAMDVFRAPTTKAFEVGMEVTVFGVRDTYNGIAQVAAGGEVTVLSEGNEVPEVPVVELITVKEALEADLGKEVYFKGIIISAEPYAEQYKNQNFTVSDNGVDAMYVYRASTTTPFEVGMEVTVKGIRAEYGGSAQIAQGAEVEVLGSGKSIPLTSITLNGDEEITLDAAPFTLDVTFAPVHTTQKNVVWSVSDESIATIAADGKITPKAVGTVVVTLKSVDNPAIEATFTIEIKAAAELELVYDYGFEDIGSQPYTDGDITYGGLVWTVQEGWIGPDANDKATATSDKMIRFRDKEKRNGSGMWLKDYYNGITQLRFDAKYYSSSHTSAQIKVYKQVEGSSDWVLVGETIQLTGEYTTYTFNINETGNVKIKIVNDINDRTWNLDNIRFYK